jgi:F0F1-type ATP synthase assembly protein I
MPPQDSPTPATQTPAPSQPVPEPVLRSFWSAIALAWELGYLIAVPAFVLGGGGAFLDKRYGTSPWILALGFTLAFLSSALLVTKRVRDILK